MCGLVGVIGKLGKDERSAFELLLALDTIRGKHSTGILSISNGNEPKILKKVGTPFDLSDDSRYSKTIFHSDKVLMGHNRYATKGSVNNINAHPFDHVSVIGSHNGTLRQQSLLDDHSDYDVDSDNLYHHMAKNGVDDTIKKLNGAFALSWWNTEENSFNLIRNDERPLYIAKAKDKEVVIYASEKWMIQVACHKNNIKTEDIMEVPPLQHLKFNLASSAHVTTFNVTPTIKAVKGYTPSKTYSRTSGSVADKFVGKDVTVSVSSVNGRNVVFDLEGEDSMQARCYIPSTENKLLTLLKSSINYFKAKVSHTVYHNNVRSLSLFYASIKEVEEEDIAIFGDKLVLLSEYEEKVKCGCAWCKTIPTPEDGSDLLTYEDGTFLCPDCKESPVVQQYLV